MLKGSEKSNYQPFATIFDTGADVHVTNAARLFIPNQPEEYSGVIGVNGNQIQAKVGILLNLGMSLRARVPCHTCYQDMNNYKVYVSKHKPLLFSKMNDKSIYLWSQAILWLVYIQKIYLSSGLWYCYANEVFIQSPERWCSESVRIERSLAYPSTEDIIFALRNGTMVNCHITIDDVKRFNMIYGKVPAELKGKMTKPGNIDQKMITTEHLTDKYLFLHTDAMFANNLPFLISVGKPIKHCTMFGIGR